jgi:hypothetical protein
VPNIVPTPCIEALFAVASVPGSVSPKRLKTSNDGETRAAVVPIAKSLILGGFMVRDQEVGGSNPLAPTRNHFKVPFASLFVRFP